MKWPCTTLIRSVCASCITATVSPVWTKFSEFRPELVINAATVKYTLDAFRQVLPVLTSDCILSDIASVKPD